MEQLNCYGLASLLDVNHQMLRRKVIDQKRKEIEQYGKLEEVKGVINLNTDQVLYVLFNLKSVEIETKIAFIRAYFEIDKKTPEFVTYEQIAEKMPVVEETVVNKTDFERFSQRIEKI